MIVYNVTINIDNAEHDAWLHWMRTEHIPEVLATGCFVSARMARVCVDEEMGGITYSIQYECDSLETLQRYQQEQAPALMAQTEKKFGGKYVAFRTHMEVVGQWPNRQ